MQTLKSKLLKFFSSSNFESKIDSVVPNFKKADIVLFCNQAAWQKMAEQLRLASWAIGSIVTAAGWKLSNPWVLFASGSTWVLRQFLAFLFDSVKVITEEHKKETNE